MLGKYIYPWLATQPDPDKIGMDPWLGFRDELAGVTLFCVALVALLTIALYRRSAVRKTIASPADAFSSYTPLRWIALTALAGLIMAGFYAVRYGKLFPDAEVSWVGVGVSVFVWATLWTLVIAYGFICIPGITPAKWRYRPLWFLYRSGKVKEEI